MADKRGDRSADDERDDELSDDIVDSDEAVDDDDEQTSTSRSGRRAEVGSAASRSGDRSEASGSVIVGMVNRLMKFFREVFAELQKVIWPTRKELLTYTAVVLIFVSFVMTVVALLDLGFAKTMFAVFGSKK